eukprot:9981-Pleurochrysis_carterae.AAC.1
MVDRALCNADGDLLVVPQLGALSVTTEMGRLNVAPGEVLVVPRNVLFSVSPGAHGGRGGDGGAGGRGGADGGGAGGHADGRAADTCGGGCRGYVLETFAPNHFVLPELGPIGANGLAEPRD